MKTLPELKQKFRHLWPHFNERGRRMVAAEQALQLGFGGISLVSRACGRSRVTITKAIGELSAKPLAEGGIRRSGAGRRALVMQDPDLLDKLDALVEPLTRGDPQSPLRWTCKSTRALSAELSGQRHPVSHEKVAQLLRTMNYSLQGNCKTIEGKNHPDRDKQFRYINEQVRQALGAGEPVIPVDTKKKELIGNYQNTGRQWRRQSCPAEVSGHDFADPSVPRAYPYGVYDLGRNTGFVNVGTDHDTGAFAVVLDSGMVACGGPAAVSEGASVADHCRSSNWRGEPLRDYETVVKLIAATTTAEGLSVTCRLDRRKYPVGRKVSDKEFATVNLKPQAFHGEWNYQILPRQNTKL